MMSNEDWRHIFALVSALPDCSQIVIVQFIMQFHRLFYGAVSASKVQLRLRDVVVRLFGAVHRLREAMV